MKFRISWKSAGLALGGGIAYWASFPPLEWAPVGWFAPLFFLAAIRGKGAETRFKTLFAGGYLVAALGLRWFWSIFQFASLALWGIFAFYFGLWGLLAGSGGERRMWWKILRPAVAWCGVEYFRGELGPLCFSWLSIGYSQTNAVGSTLAPWVGVYGISFVMVLWAAAVTELLRRIERPAGHRWRRGGLVVAAMAIPLLALFSISQWKGKSVGTAALQQFEEGTEPGVDRRLPDRTPARAVDLAVWPEYSFFSNPYSPSGAWVLDTVKPVAARARWGLVFGAIRVPEGRSRQEAFYDTAWFLSPAGDPIGGAGKNRPIQLMNDGLPAPEVTVLPVTNVPSPRRPGDTLRIGIGICYDGSYQRFARRMAAGDADLLVFPVYNASRWGDVEHRQHQRMFQMRAMETRLPVLTAAYNGPTFAAAPNGSVISALPFGKTELLSCDIPLPSKERTHFCRIGWWIGPLCLLVTAGGTLPVFRRYFFSLLDTFRRLLHFE